MVHSERTRCKHPAKREYAYRAATRGCRYYPAGDSSHQSLRRHSFEAVASILVEHYSGVTMKDSRTLMAQSNPANQLYRPRTGKGQGYSSGSGKGRTGYSAAIAEDEEEWLPRGETMDFWDQGYEYEPYELEFEEAEALNALEDVERLSNCNWPRMLHSGGPKARESPKARTSRARLK